MLAMDEVARARLRKKLAKQSLPFSQYPAILELETHHQVDLGFAYSTPDSARIFTSYIRSRESVPNLS